MKLFFKNLITLLILPILIFRKNYFWAKTDKTKLPAIEFARFGFTIGKRILLKGKVSPKLLLNPVSIVRHFEFHFANSNSNMKDGFKVLDVSSPYLFGFFQASRFDLEYDYINPDPMDLANVNSLSNKLIFKAKYSVRSGNVLNLTHPDNYFDRVFSISVIEHIADEGDTKAMKEIWRVLKTEGLFIFTIPVKKYFEIEYKDIDEYHLSTESKADKYFFQRIYDEVKIKERLLSSIDNYEIISKKIFGCKENNFYSEYSKRWSKYSYWETVKDPYYITKKFSYYNEIHDLEDIGVIGLTIKKIK